MDYIAYNTTLDISNLVSSTKQDKAMQKLEKEIEFENNKRELLPYVLKYLHYMVDLHNSVVIKNCFAGGDYRTNVRLTSLRDIKHLHNGGLLDLQEVLARYTDDFYFLDNGVVWKCQSFKAIITKDAPKIWLHKEGKHAHNSNMPYSMEGFGKFYAESVEDYIQDLTKAWINSERN